MSGNGWSYTAADPASRRHSVTSQVTTVSPSAAGQPFLPPSPLAASPQYLSTVLRHQDAQGTGYRPICREGESGSGRVV